MGWVCPGGPHPPEGRGVWEEGEGDAHSEPTRCGLSCPSPRKTAGSFRVLGFCPRKGSFAGLWGDSVMTKMPDRVQHA